MILMMHKAFQDQGDTWLSIMEGAFKGRRGWILKLMQRQLFSYKKRNKKNVTSEDELWKKCQKLNAGLRNRIKNPCLWYNVSNTNHM